MSSPPSPSYQVVARRFRPVVFDDVVGQPAVLTTLKACLASERLPHAFLFCGSRGIGKTTTARILARAINCEAGLGPDPCGTCAACKGVLDGSANDVVELDAASNNGVDEVRAMREQAAYAPIRLRRKVFILDEAHMFSKSAFNALLKILEEPPAHVVFVLATTEPHKIPETVRSRCQVLTFRRIHNGDIKGRLERICAQEGVSIADEVLTDIAASAMGGLRDAETALERILPLADSLDLDGYRRLVGRLGPTRAADLVEACMRADARQALLYANEAFETGVDERECLGEVLQVLRHVFALLVDGSETLLVEASGEWRARLAAIAAATDLVRVDAMVQIVVLARERIRQLEDRRVLLELTLVRLARLGELVSVGEMIEQAPQQPSTASPAAAPSPAPAPPRGGDVWVRAVEETLAERPAVGALLEQATPHWDAAGHLDLVWPGLKEMERSQLEASAEWLTARLSKLAGHAVAIQVKTGEAQPEDGTKASVQAKPASSDELPPLGRVAADLFGVSHVERQE